MHVHVYSDNCEAKFWIEPDVALAQNVGFSDKKIGILQKIIEERYDEIRDSWRKHFGS